MTGTESFWPNDGRSRVHIPTTPLWIAILRILQVGLVVAALAATAYAIADLKRVVAGLHLIIEGWHGAEGYPMTWWAFSWTFIYLVWLLVALIWAPALYNLWAHL